MSHEESDRLLQEAAAAAVEEHVVESDSLDDENRLKRDYVRKVREALDAGENDAVYALVEPLHPADIADLFELIDGDDRPALARAITDLMGSEVFAELNDHVREALVESLPADEVADIAEQLDTDDAVAMLEDLDEEDRALVLMRFAENHDYEQLAEMFGTSAGACRMRISRIREKLAVKAGGLFGGDRDTKG